MKPRQRSKQQAMNEELECVRGEGGDGIMPPTQVPLTRGRFAPLAIGCPDFSSLDSTRAYIGMVAASYVAGDISAEQMKALMYAAQTAMSTFRSGGKK